MHPQLRAVENDFKDARRRLHALVEIAPDQLWSERPDPARWSIAECVAHLNLTAKQYLPLLRDAITRGRRYGKHFVGKYRRDLKGWLLWKSMGPPVRFRVKTKAPFMPNGSYNLRELVQEFDGLQDEQIRCVEEANGLALRRIKVASPFNPRLKYNLYSCFTILPRHQHRHLWQAEQVLKRLEPGS